MNKYAVITGGTKGIGKSLVLSFAKEGFNIITNSRNANELEQLKNEITSKYDVSVKTVVADFQNKNEVEAFGNFIINNVEHVNILINNAGIFIPGQTMQEEEGVFEKEISINLAAPYFLTRTLIKHLRKSKDAYIFNMCSTASFTPYINGGSYCISKFGLLGFTKVLRQELKADRIAVSAIMPGATLTDSWKESDLPSENFMSPDDIAEFVIQAWKQRKKTVLEEIILRPYPGDIS